MAIKRGSVLGFYTLLLIVFIPVLLIYSIYSISHLYPSTPITPNFKKPEKSSTDFTLTIKVLTYDRLASLSRCLQSLSAAHYDQNVVNRHIYIDHFNYDQNVVNLHIYIDHFKFSEKDENLDQKLNESKRILEFVDGFEWKFEGKMVHYRTENVGLQTQWLEAWWPVSDHEFVFVVEDDIELSPLYYRFLKGLIVNYYYNATNYSPWIYGASLQRPRFVPGKHGNKIHLNKETQVFLYQLVGTWGQLLFPKPWKEFRLWYDAHKTKGMKPILDGMDGIKRWETRYGLLGLFIHARGYFNIYTNFLHETSLSVSHRDAGVNYGKTAGPDSNLIQEDSSESKFLELEPLRNLKWYDFCFREVIPDRIVKSVHELDPVLKSAQQANALVLVSIEQTSETFTRNFLCHFERLNVRNYVFMGSVSSFLLDLSRRGHPVINVDRFFDSIKEYKFIKFSKEILVKAYVIKKALEMKYDTWVWDRNMLPVNADLFLGSVKLDSTADFYVGKRFGLLFARRSGSEIWTDSFLNEIAQMADSNMGKYETSFGVLAGKLLERKDGTLKRFDEAEFSVKIDVGNDFRTSLKNDASFAFWSSDIGYDLVRNRLESLGLWIIDAESHCTAVICNPS